MSGYTSPAEIDQQFIDVDFGPASEEAGRVCGMTPTPDDLMRAWPDYEAAMPTYPRDKWPDLIAAKDTAGGWPYRRITTPHDQNGDPSCTYNATALAHEITFNTEFGDHNCVGLSPMSGYHWNGSRTSGSSVGGAIKWLSETGLLPVNSEANKAKVAAGLFAHTHPHNGYGNSFADGWKDTAKFFRADEWFRVSTVEAWVSAIINGFVCVGGRDSHCIGHCGLAMDGGKILSIYAQSWGIPWGFSLDTSIGNIKTFGADSESKIKTMVAREGWCLRTVLRPSWIK
jgi:hypothetical protein